jgi:hypothetical protein
VSKKTHEIVALALLTAVVAVIAGACPDAHAEPAPPVPGASGEVAVADEAGASLFVRHCSICPSRVLKKSLVRL